MEEAWRKVMGVTDQEMKFMEFEEREGMNDDDEGGY